MSDKETSICFASVDSALIDFAALDLSPWGIQGGRIEAPQTEEFIVSNSMDDNGKRNWDIIKKNAQGFGDGVGKRRNWEFINLLWPIDINNPPSKDDYFEAIEALRIAHPSEVYISNIFMSQYFEDNGFYINAWLTFDSQQTNKYQEIEDHYLYYPEEKLGETNEFLAFYYEKVEKRGYIRNAIKYYAESFRVNSPEMAFVCLCICLETIVPGKEQLSYKFRRNVAVLCSNNMENGKLICKNANLLYSYRSKLVHSGMDKKNFKKFDLFFEYAQILASRMIIEMLLHDIPQIDELDKSLTELGFGDRSKISSKYNEFKGNLITWHKVSTYKFD